MSIISIRHIQAPVTVDVGSLTVEVTPATPVVDTPTGEVTLDPVINIPAGKTLVQIINKGASVPVGGVYGADASITVTCGSLVMELPVDPLGDGFRIKASGFNAALNTYGTLPVVSIDNSGGAAIEWNAV